MKESDDGEREISGSVLQITFRNEDTGYVVCRIKSAESIGSVVTVVGNCAAIWVGEELSATGRWINDKRFGLQFAASEIQCIVPTSPEGIRRFLAGGLIHGIGKEIADRIVDRFGSDTLYVLEHASARLEEVDGIGKKRRQTIRRSWEAQRGIRDVMIFLQANGIGMGVSARIYRTYGLQSVAIVKQNPYRLCEEVWGIGFKTADQIAMRLGIEKSAPSRISAGVLHALSSAQEEGHCYLEEAALLLKASEMLSVAPEEAANVLPELVNDGKLVSDNGKIYASALYKSEVNAARRLCAILSAPLPFPPIDAERALKWVEGRLRLVLAEGQRKAVRHAISGKVTVITGGPGVGKTTIIKALTEILSVRKLKICLAAPTGRAAKRMTEATGLEATTIHRLLKYMPQNGRFSHNEDNPLDADVLIVDEFSMMDIVLADHLLRATGNHAVLVFVGDTDQLPSVGPGNVLGDIIASGEIPCVRLDAIFRQDSTGMIVRNAHRINNGQEIEGGGEDFFFIETKEPESVLERIADLAVRRIPSRFGIPTSEIQVLTPMRRNLLGSDNLNERLQEAINPSGPSLKRGNTAFRLGDRVMQMRNNYDKEVFNGDVGAIREVDGELLEIAVEYDGRLVRYGKDELDELVLAYASTVHKSQGSEYKAVIIAIATQHFKLLKRNLLYTAVTRGKKLVCIVGSHKAAAIAIRNSDVGERNTFLSCRIKAMVSGSA